MFARKKGREKKKGLLVFSSPPCWPWEVLSHHTTSHNKTQCCPVSNQASFFHSRYVLSHHSTSHNKRQWRPVGNQVYFFFHDMILSRHSYSHNKRQRAIALSMYFVRGSLALQTRRAALDLPRLVIRSNFSFTIKPSVPAFSPLLFFLLFYLYSLPHHTHSPSSAPKRPTSLFNMTPLTVDHTIKYYQLGDFELQSGEILPAAYIAYKTYGNPTNPCIVYPTWYSGTIVDGNEWLISTPEHPRRALDPERFV